MLMVHSLVYGFSSSENARSANRWVQQGIDVRMDDARQGGATHLALYNLNVCWLLGLK